MIEVADIKLAVLRCALGICAIEEVELYKRLEAFWVEAYKQGGADTCEAVKALCDERSLKLVAQGMVRYMIEGMPSGSATPVTSVTK